MSLSVLVAIQLVLPALLSGTLALLLVPLALRTGWVDHPNPRKVHEHATPLVGGVAIYVALAAILWLPPGGLLTADRFVVALLAGSLSLLVVGLVDDLRGLSARLRLLFQAGVCLLMIRYGEVRLTDFGALFSGNVLELGLLALPLTVFAAMGVINAFNLIDGMDGLAGGIFLVAAAGMALFAAQAGHLQLAVLLIVALSAVAGFLLLNARLPWNRKARLFLGDAGSLMLGFLLAWCFIRLGNGADRAFMPMTAVWLFAVPLLDTSTLIWMRWREGRSAIAADQRHLHHAFLRAGFSVEQTWVAIMLAALLLAVAGALFELSRLPDCVSFYAFMAVAFGYYFYLRHSWAAQRFLGRHFIHHDFTFEEQIDFSGSGRRRSGG